VAAMQLLKASKVEAIWENSGLFIGLTLGRGFYG